MKVYYFIQSITGQTVGIIFRKEAKSPTANRVCGEITMPGNWRCIYNVLSITRNIIPSSIVLHESEKIERSFPTMYSYYHNKTVGHRNSGKEFFKGRCGRYNRLA